MPLSYGWMTLAQCQFSFQNAMELRFVPLQSLWPPTYTCFLNYSMPLMLQESPHLMFLSFILFTNATQTSYRMCFKDWYGNCESLGSDPLLLWSHISPHLPFPHELNDCARNPKYFWVQTLLSCPCSQVFPS